MKPVFLKKICLCQKIHEESTIFTYLLKKNYRDLPLLQATSRRKVLALSASSKAVRRPMTEVCLRCTEKFVVRGVFIWG